MKIDRYDGWMTPRERVLSAFEREQADRVPIGYDANDIVHTRLARALGLDPGDYDAVLNAIGVDLRGVGAAYTGRRLHAERPGMRVDPMVGTVTRYVENPSGGYWDYSHFPLKDAEPEVIASFPLPDPDDFDYEGFKARVKLLKGYALHIGHPGMGCEMGSLGLLMGDEDAMIRMYMEDEAVNAYLDRRDAYQLEMLERMVEACPGQIDVLWLGEDLGTQRGPLIGRDMYLRTMRSRHQRYIDLAKAFGLKTLFHTCGSSSWVYEDFIEMGVDAVDTLQPEAFNMSPAYLVNHFGGRLSFRGCISTAGPLAYGNERDVERAVCETLDVMLPTNAYLLAPTHAIQDNTPVKNIIAMYNAAHKFGRYGA